MRRAHDGVPLTNLAKDAGMEHHSVNRWLRKNWPPYRQIAAGVRRVRNRIRFYRDAISEFRTFPQKRWRSLPADIRQFIVSEHPPLIFHTDREGRKHRRRHGLGATTLDLILLELKERLAEYGPFEPKLWEKLGLHRLTRSRGTANVGIIRLLVDERHKSEEAKRRAKDDYAEFLRKGWAFGKPKRYYPKRAPKEGKRNEDAYAYLRIGEEELNEIDGSKGVG